LKDTPIKSSKSSTPKFVIKHLSITRKDGRESCFPRCFYQSYALYEDKNVLIKITARAPDNITMRVRQNISIEAKYLKWMSWAMGRVASAKKIKKLGKLGEL
jgi:hypothetical protein